MKYSISFYVKDDVYYIGKYRKDILFLNDNMKALMHDCVNRMPAPFEVKDKVDSFGIREVELTQELVDTWDNTYDEIECPEDIEEQIKGPSSYAEYDVNTSLPTPKDCKNLMFFTAIGLKYMEEEE